MPSVVPYFDDPRDLTFTASGAVTGGRMVEAVDPGDRLARTSGAASATSVGMAAYNAANGEKFTVLRGQVLPGVASGAITAGAKLVTTATGALKARAAEGVETIVGQSYEDAADGEFFRAYIY